MSRTEDYRQILCRMPEWDQYLLEKSGLPGPRGNIELAQAVADEGDRERFERYLGYTAEIAPVNSPYEFLAFCGTLGLGKLLAEGDIDMLDRLRVQASDARWRVREAVAMALQRYGEVDMRALIDAMQGWCEGQPLEQRAAAAALCEPRLLKQPQYTHDTLEILDRITATIEMHADRRSEEFMALRKGMGYCWSVAVAASPEGGKARMEKWLASSDKDIQWIMQENLKKNRLNRIDSQWVEHWKK